MNIQIGEPVSLQELRPNYEKELEASSTFKYLWELAEKEQVNICIYGDKDPMELGQSNEEKFWGCIFFPEMQSAVVLGHELAHAVSTMRCHTEDSCVNDERRSYAFQKIIRLELQDRDFTVPNHEYEIDEEQLLEEYENTYKNDSGIHPIIKPESITQHQLIPEYPAGVEL